MRRVAQHAADIPRVRTRENRSHLHSVSLSLRNLGILGRVSDANDCSNFVST